MKKWFVIFILIFPSVAFSQQGQILIVQDSSIQRALNLYSTLAKGNRQVNGYRIQLATNNNRQTLLTMKATFLQQYPEVPAYVQYAAPQFKLRTGDFSTRAEADQFCIEARVYFSSAFVVPDKIIVEGVTW
ncbi:MAG: SPOR domain-containing protein [Chitinophagales bacterium]|nr:SPOR domain-containing protein [Chitinophagales bacterium]